LSCTNFEKHMEIISKKYDPVSIDELQYLLENCFDDQKKYVCVTFDDGFKDNAENAIPIMNKYGIKCTIYVSTNFVKKGYLWFLLTRNAFYKTQKKIWIDQSVGKSYNLLDKHEKRAAFLRVVSICCSSCVEDIDLYIRKILDDLDVDDVLGDGAKPLTQSDILSIRSQGHIIGSHTVGHPNMAHIDLNQAQIEAEESKNFLESILKENVFHFSYPSPYLQPIHNINTKNILIHSGYKTAVTCDHGVVNSRTDSYSIPRCVVPADKTDFNFLLEKLFFNGK